MDTDIIAIFFKSSLWSKEKKFRISNDFVVLEHTSEELINSLNLRDFEGFKFAIYWSYFFFPLGLNFKLELKNKNGQNFKIRLFSLLGLNRNTYHRSFNELYSAINEKLIKPKCADLINSVLNNETITLNNLAFDKHQVTIKEGRRREKSYFYSDLEVIEFQSYFTVVLKSTQWPIADIRYKEDWNASMVFALLNAMMSRERDN